MKHRKAIWLSLVLLFVVTSCKSTDQNPSTSFDTDLVSDIIDAHESTIIFIWSSWCQASQETFCQIVVPFLSELHEGVGVVLVHFGKIDEIPEMIIKQNTVINLSTHNGLDKLISNAKLYLLLKDYHYHNAMPMTILVDKQRHVQNYDSGKNRYLSFTEVLWRIKEP